MCNKTNIPHVLGSLTLTAVRSMSDVDTTTTRKVTLATPSCSISPTDCVALNEFVSSQNDAMDTSLDKIWTRLLLSSTLAFTQGNSRIGYNTTTFPSGLTAAPTLTIDGSTVTADSNELWWVTFTGPFGSNQARLMTDGTAYI
jgi:hypothetical protein